MELSRKELKKISHSFNTISNRMMRVDYSEYVMVLKKFLGFIESTPIIMEYVNIAVDDKYDAVTEWDTVVNKVGYMFDFGLSSEEESYQIFTVLKHIDAIVQNPSYEFMKIYGERKLQDNVKEFNDRVLLVLINNINDYLTGVGIDMGLDENVVWNVSGGQVNVASDNATINAVQNNGSSVEEVEKLVQAILDNLSGLSQDDMETIRDSVEMIKEEIMKPEPKGKIISNGIKLLAPMITVANGIPMLVNNIQNFIEYVKQFM